MAHIDLVPERRPDGTIVLRAVVRDRGGSLRRLIRRLAAAPA